MKSPWSNASYGAMDYLSYPLGMLIVTPIILRHLGAAEYGLWMVSTSIVSAGGILASGFGDAGIQHIALLRSTHQGASIEPVLRSLLLVNGCLGAAIATIVWSVAPFVSHRLALSHLLPSQECLFCVRISASLILVRAIESVFVSAQKALQEYRNTVQISVATRLVTLGSAAALAVSGGRTDSILIATTLALFASAALQFCSLHRLFPSAPLWPGFHVSELKSLFQSGAFVWLQTLGSIAFRQFDRILLGIVAGAAVVAPYAVSIQIAEPLFGLTASSLSFFLPYLSSRRSLSASALRRSISKAFLCNLFLVSFGTGILLIFGGRLLRAWAGLSVAQSATPILSLVVLGSALSGLSVVGTYTAQALGLFRTVAFLSLCSRALLSLLMFYLLRRYGLTGLATSRLLYGAASLLVYAPLLRHHVFRGRLDSSSQAASSHLVLQEKPQP